MRPTYSEPQLKAITSIQIFFFFQALPCICPQRKAYANHPCRKDCIFWHKDLPASKVE